jgi:parallel beta-helix repeat protein
MQNARPGLVFAKRLACRALAPLSNPLGRVVLVIASAAVAAPPLIAPTNASPAAAVEQSQSSVEARAKKADVGPQPGVVCPAGAVEVRPGIQVQQLVDAHPPRTVFCLRAGLYRLTSPITPKTGNTFIGEYGAVLDGTGWTTKDTTQGAFRAHNQDIDDVVIRNLVIRNMPQKGIHAFKDFADKWTIEHNEIASSLTGLLFPNNSIVRHNYIHHNVGDSSSSVPADRGGGYMGYFVRNTTFDANEIAYNGMEQKAIDSTDVVFRNNFVHHNVGDGIWFDGTAGGLIEGNRVEDNGRNGIVYEASVGGVVRNNTVQRSRDTAIFVSVSREAEIYDNTLEDNLKGIVYFVDCAVTANNPVLDLRAISTRDNTIRLGTQNGALANGFSHSGCTSTQAATYLGVSKKLTFSNNRYYVPSPPSGSYWTWDGRKQWAQWQSIGHDRDGAVSR